MNLTELPPMFGALLLRDGRVFAAQSLAEMIEQERSTDFRLALSTVGELEISTVFLRLNTCPFFDKKPSPGDEVVGLNCFETMVACGDSVSINRHQSIEQAVDFHLQARKAYAAEKELPAEWVLRPYRCQNHGQPSLEMSFKLKREGEGE